ncbi:MAG: prepilin-type N-terminal cleavage/methylation domain-containing protein [Bacillota bacterium]|nr:prepilin-type N-terminal cleavage/methylation domain-containing protein [Bacillota bacterium]
MDGYKVAKKRRGFTLIELVVVIVIIGILSGLAALNLNQAGIKSRDGVATANLRTMKSAISLYQSEHKGAYPRPLGNQAAAQGHAAVIGLDNFKQYLEERTFQEPGEDYTYKYEMDSSGSAVLTVRGGKLDEPPVEGENRYTFK